jgi:valyl-tRNA synthetase
MTLKEAIKEVVSNRLSLYPNGWDTEIGKILQNTVQDFCISLRGSHWWGETGGVNIFMLYY